MFHDIIVNIFFYFLHLNKSQNSALSISIIDLLMWNGLYLIMVKVNNI